MNDGQNDGSKAEIDVRFAPKFIREERRKQRVGGILGVLASIVTIADAIDAIRTHRMVNLGPSHGYLTWPPYPVLVIGLLLLVGSAWVLWKPGIHNK
jgi:hypothetical protein